MQKSILIAVASLAIGVTAAIADDPAPQSQSSSGSGEGRKVMVSEQELEKVTATIQDIDHSTRELTLKLPDGDTVKAKASDQVPNFDSLKKGDKATVRYYESVAISLAKPGESVAPASAAEVTLVPKDATNPAEMKAATMEISATVENIDASKHELKLKGPAGRTFNVKVDPSRDLSEIKKGDKIIARITEAVAVSADVQ